MNDAIEYFRNFETDRKKGNLELAYRLSRSTGKPLGDEKLSMLKTVEKGHGRIEKRTYYYSTSIDWMIDAKKEWAGLLGVGMVERETETAGEITRGKSYYSGSIVSIKEFEKAARNHWKILCLQWFYPDFFMPKGLKMPILMKGRDKKSKIAFTEYWTLYIKKAD